VALTTPDWENTEDSARGNRLDCWKEIAAYLGRSEKTVRRWEIERGLPTHRAPGEGRTAVYAYTAALDEWLKSRRTQDLNAAEAAEDRVGLVVKSESPIAMPSVEPPDPRPIATVANLQAGWRGFRPGWKPMLVGILAAGAVALTIYAVAPRSAAAGIRRRISSLFGTAHAASIPPGFATVSDAEKTRAHEFYLNGRYEWSQRTPESLNRALDDFTQAIVHDPNDAKSYAGLADTYNLLQIFSTLPLADSYPRAIAAAKRAIALDDSLAEAHRALAFSEFYGLGDWRDSEKEFLRAIQLDPKDPLTRCWYGNAFAMPGRFEESLAQLDKAQELDPTSNATLSNKAVILYNAGRLEEGVAILKDIERSNPDYYLAHFYRMGISFHSRDFRTFLDEGQKAAEIRNDPVLKDVIASAREGYARAGENGLMKSFYTKQKDYYEMGKYSPAMLAITCVALGKRQEALDLLEAAYSHRLPDALWSLTDPDLAALKDEPRYKALVKKIDFPSAPPSY
jgi:tetratricopeptide (TPR) repeat protein